MVWTRSFSGARRLGAMWRAQQSLTLTARPPSLVSVYFVIMSRPVWRMVSITMSSETMCVPSPSSARRAADTAVDTAASSTISLINGAQASNVFWQALGAVGTAVGTGASSSFTGTIMSLGAITVGASAILKGRALSHGGTVTLSTNSFTAVGGALGISAPAASQDLGTGGASGTLTELLGQVASTSPRGVLPRRPSIR